MGAQMQRVRFSTTFEDIRDINPSFAAGKMRIAYVGDNRNGSSISKQVLQAAIPSMFNCPVVARYDRASNSFGSHDVELVLKDNTIKIVNVTQPVGVVPLGAEYSFETDVDANGVEHEYLSTTVYLWKRQEAFEHICELGTIDESMECVFEESHVDERGYLVADRMYFEAFCLLESAEPCYEGAGVEVSTEALTGSFNQQFARLQDELAQLPNAVPDSAAQICQEGGKADMDFETKIAEMLNEFGLTKEDLDFEISEDMELEDIREKVSALAAERVTASEAADEPADEGETDEAADGEAETDAATDEGVADEGAAGDDSAPAAVEAALEQQTFAATYNAKRDALRDLLKPVFTETTETYFYLMDFDDTYAYVERDTWTLPDYSLDEDYGRYGYSFDEEARIASLTSDFEPMVVTWLTEDEYKALENRRAMLDELIEFRNATMAKTYQDNLTDLLNEFADLKDVEEFATYTAKVKELAASEDTRLDLEDVRNHCFCIRGKQVKNFNEKLDDKKVPHVPVAPKATIGSDDPVGLLFNRFLK